MSETGKSGLEPVPKIVYTTIEAWKQGLTRDLKRGRAYSYKPLITTADFYLIYNSEWTPRYDCTYLINCLTLNKVIFHSIDTSKQQLDFKAIFEKSTSKSIVLCIVLHGIIIDGTYHFRLTNTQTLPAESLVEPLFNSKKECKVYFAVCYSDGFITGPPESATNYNVTVINTSKDTDKTYLLSNGIGTLDPTLYRLKCANLNIFTQPVDCVEVCDNLIYEKFERLQK